MFYHELDESFKLYKKTDWGSQDTDIDPVEEKVIEYRKLLAMTCPEMKHIKRLPKYVSEIINNLPKNWNDNIEVYKIPDLGYMIFSSAYSSDDFPDELKIEELGWKLCPSIYSNDTHTIGYWCPCNIEFAIYNENISPVDIFLENFRVYLIKNNTHYIQLRSNVNDEGNS